MVVCKTYNFSCFMNRRFETILNNLMLFEINYNHHLQNVECISNAFSKYVETDTRGVYNICSLPWTMSMLKLTDYNSTNHQSGCKLSDAIKQNKETISFFSEAKNYNVTGCKGEVYLTKICLHPTDIKIKFVF